MLVANDEKYLAEVRAFAERTGQLQNLEEKLAYLDTYACRVQEDLIDRTLTRCLLARDHAPYSFDFTMQRQDPATGEYRYWFNGGCIYHGPHDGFGSGAAPTYAVAITPSAGWLIHT